jgi:thiamine-monophosphate kinase
VNDEFEDIARLFRPLTWGAPEALGLLDDAAVIPSRPGFDLVVTKDAMVEGVHFLPEDAPEMVARKLLRVNLSDLAAKAAAPYAYFLSVAWPKHYDAPARAAFAAGLALDQAAFGLTLLGGDTVSTPGPLTVSATMLGWVENGAMVRRGGAAPGDVVLVTGYIGDGGLGLKAARGELSGLEPEMIDYLAGRYRLPEPRVGLREVLAREASASADVSDGIVADAGHIGAASGVAIQIDLERLPLSPAAKAWVATQPSAVDALAELAGAGDDYEVVCTATMAGAMRLALAAAGLGLPITPIGRVGEGEGTIALHRGVPVRLDSTGWRHR